MQHSLPLLQVVVQQTLEEKGDAYIYTYMYTYTHTCIHTNIYISSVYVYRASPPPPSFIGGGPADSGGERGRLALAAPRTKAEHRPPRLCRQPRRPNRTSGANRTLASDILSLIGCCARINDHCITPPTCIAHTVAIRLHSYCTVCNPLPTPRFHAIHHTILCIAISCKG